MSGLEEAIEYTYIYLLKTAFRSVSRGCTVRVALLMNLEERKKINVLMWRRATRLTRKEDTAKTVKEFKYEPVHICAVFLVA
jgi:hypothetical protein